MRLRICWEHEPHEADANTDDDANNARVLRELKNVPAEKRGRDLCACWLRRATARRWPLFAERPKESFLKRRAGANGFGYDPLFYFPQIQKTFAELSAEEKSRYSHRGAAFRQFLDWYVESQTCVSVFATEKQSELRRDDHSRGRRPRAPAKLRC